MNFNFSSFLSSSLKILNIANKAIPLIKEVNPTVTAVKKQINNFKSKMPGYAQSLNFKEKNPENNNTNKKVINNKFNNSTLTFFR